VEARPPSARGVLDLDGRLRDLFTREAPTASVLSGTDGSYSISGLAEGTWRIDASAPGFDSACEEGVLVTDAGRSASLSLTLGPSHDLLVRAVDRQGRPAPGFAVAAMRRTGNSEAPFGAGRGPATTDTAGLARLRGLAPGRYLVFLHAAEGRLPCEETEVPRDREVTVSLGGDRVYEVRTDGPGSSPVEGATVSVLLLHPGGFGGVFLRGTSGRDGLTRFEGVTAGAPVFLSAEREGHARSARWKDSRFPGLILTGDSVETVALARLTLSREATLEGTVRRLPGGAPVPGARVTVLHPLDARFGPSRSAVSGPDGSYRLTGLQPGRAILVAHAEGLATPGAPCGWTTPFRLPDGGSPDTDIVVDLAPGPEASVRDISVERTATLSGRLVSEDGDPIPGGLVLPFPSRESGYSYLDPRQDLRPRAALSAADGSFRIEQVAATKGADLLAAAPGHLLGSLRGIPVAAGAVVEGLEIRLGRGSVVQGRVTGPDGAPIPGASVLLSPWGMDRVDDLGVRLPGRSVPRFALTDAEGNYRLEGVPPWSHDATFMADGRVSWTKRGLRPSDALATTADAELEQELEVKGRVVDPTGAPLGRARVTIRNTDRGPASGILDGEARTESDGSFRIRGLPAGAWDLTVRAPDFPTVRLRSLDSGGPSLDIRLPPPVGIHGRVTDERGDPLYGVLVTAEAESGRGPRGDATTGRDGSFAIPNLARGRFRLRVDGWQGIVEGGTSGLEIRPPSR
jgi:protocatechuate 3,4-dioxygenase beta subunit